MAEIHDYRNVYPFKTQKPRSELSPNVAVRERDASIGLGHAVARDRAVGIPDVAQEVSGVARLAREIRRRLGREEPRVCEIGRKGTNRDMAGGGDRGWSTWAGQKWTSGA